MGIIREEVEALGFSTTSSSSSSPSSSPTSSPSSSVEVTPNPDEVVSVENFGAIGNGETDNTDAIQAALDHADSTTIYFPDGRYKISDTLQHPGRKKMLGQSSWSTVLFLDGNTRKPMLQSSADTNQHGIIQSIRFNGAWSTPFTQNQSRTNQGSNASMPLHYLIDLDLSGSTGEVFAANTDQTVVDHEWKLIDIVIENAACGGMKLNVGRGSIIDKVTIHNCGFVGLYMLSADTNLSNFHIGQCHGNGLVFGSACASTQVSTGKVFFSGYNQFSRFTDFANAESTPDDFILAGHGVNVVNRGAHTSMSNIQSQDGAGPYGFYIGGSNNTLSGMQSDTPGNHTQVATAYPTPPDRKHFFINSAGTQLTGNGRIRTGTSTTYNLTHVVQFSGSGCAAGTITHDDDFLTAAVTGTQPTNVTVTS